MSGGDLAGLEQLAGRMLAALSPAERGKATRAIAVDLRRSQSTRIGQQRNPDGSSYEPRKQREPLRAKRGRIKRKAKRGPMFKKLRRLLKPESTPDEAAVTFAQSAVSRIAGVHHFGLRDRVTRRRATPEATYPARRLLGLTDADRQRILQILVDRLSANA